MTAKHSLLDWLQAATNCQYLSDLRTGINGSRLPLKLCEQILICPEDAYPLTDWKMAAEYLTQKPCHAATVEEVKAILCNAERMPSKVGFDKRTQR